MASSRAMRESGQTIIEWLAVLAGVVTLAAGAAIAVPSVAPAVSGGMQTAICDVAEQWFTPAYVNHDRCYGAHQGKAACDTAFLNDMLATCATLPASGGVNPTFTRASCRAAAHLYYKGVVIGGGFSYCHRAVCRDRE